jgi:meiotic recombination protein SPO11
MQLPLTACDRNKLEFIRRHPDLQDSHPEWLKQVDLMSTQGKKAEIQSFSKISSDYLFKIYLPLKIKNSAWVS